MNKLFFECVLFTDEQDRQPMSSPIQQPQERRPPTSSSEFKMPYQVNEAMKREFRNRFPRIGGADRECRKAAHALIVDVIKCSHCMTVDELSERVQRHYQVGLPFFLLRYKRNHIAKALLY